MMMLNVSGYLELTKPKVTLLNMFVGLTCFVLVAFPLIDWLRLVAFLFAGYLAAGGCGSVNCFVDADLDRLMLRTAKRAVPTGKVPRINALLYGIALIASGLAVAYFFLNTLSMGMMVLGAVTYLGVYTAALKRASSWNVVIGGSAGCFAALAGWAASGASLTLLPLLVVVLDFVWTPAHLWGLVIRRMGEYRGAGVPMLPVTLGVKRASWVILLFNLITFAVSMLLAVFGGAGLLYMAFAVPAGCVLLLVSAMLVRFGSPQWGFRAFMVSMPYLVMIMSGLIIDAVVRTSIAL